MVRLIKEKRGWIRIVEAFVSILLIAGVLVFLISQGYLGKTTESKEIREFELSVLREIQLNDELRNNALNAAVPNSDSDPNYNAIKDLMNSRKQDYIECSLNICEVTDACGLSINYPDKDVYADSVIITATIDNYQPKKLKMFCWYK